MRGTLAVLLACALLAGCGGGDKASDPSAPDDTTAETTAETTTDTTADSTVAETAPPATDAPVDALPAEQVAQLVAERPYNIFVPSTYDPATPMPLVLLLHGFRANATIIEDYFQFKALAEERGFIYIFPEGTANEFGDQFWNATEACCGGSSAVDDSTYLRAVIQDISGKLSVDSKQVYIVGYSNGGFMAYRMACDHADLIAAVVSVAGANHLDPTECAPSQPVSVLEVHGTADTIIYYDGGTFMQPNAYPSATDTVAAWSSYNKCTTGADPAPFDLDPFFPGDEANVVAFESCADDTAVELWTVPGVGHAPVPATSGYLLIDFLYAHARA